MSKFFKPLQTLPAALAFLSIGLWTYADICTDNISCTLRPFLWSIMFSVLKPLHILSIVLIIPFLVLAFVSKDVFSKWLKFSYWTVPIILLILAFMSKPDMGYGFGIITLDGTAQLLGILYAIATMIIVVRK